MTEALAAERSERVDGCLGYRSGIYSRSLITPVGTIELRIPRDRSGLFSTELFERFQRSERALVSTLPRTGDDWPGRPLPATVNARWSKRQ
jgi:putative transposase